MIDAHNTSNRFTLRRGFTIILDVKLFIFFCASAYLPRVIIELQKEFYIELIDEKKKLLQMQTLFFTHTHTHTHYLCTCSLMFVTSSFFVVVCNTIKNNNSVTSVLRIVIVHSEIVQKEEKKC